jgi:hypothetical protein
MINVLDSMLNNIDEIPRRLGEFRIRIGSVGTWLMQVRSQPLSVDAVYILSADAETPDNGGGFWARLWHSIVSLVLSFFIDFNSLGDAGENGAARTIEVWLGTGRDQMVILRQMIDETFTRETGIGVNLSLVDMNMLLPATVSGQGPDVAIQVGVQQPSGIMPTGLLLASIDLPMNYAFRGAVADISGFPGFDEVAERFAPAAMTPFTYDGIS